MATIWVREFTGGLDVRRIAETSPGGTLIRARDCHINRGGEIEQRADFVTAYSLPPGLTKGLAQTPTGLVVFGHQATPSGIPAGVTYQRLQHPSGEALERIVDFTLYNGKLHVIGEFADGSRWMFYDGTIINDVDAPPTKADSGRPSALLTHIEKVFVGSGPNLFFSAVGDSEDFGGTGAGFVVMSTHADGSEELTGLSRYDQFVAVFSRRTTQIWYFDPDPNLTRQAQVLNNTGAIAPRSITQFGDGDVFYLDRSGVRSLRARNSSNSAATTDIGSPIDGLINALTEEIGGANVARAIGLIEPRSGNFWLAIRDRIFVFSYYPENQVSAWSEYRPGFVVEDMLTWGDRTWLRSGDTIYAYGGFTSGCCIWSYSEDVQAEAWLPYLDGDQPFRLKHLTGVDVAVRGTWEVRVALDPNNLAVSDLVARVDQTTYPLERVPYEASGNLLSFRFKALAPPAPNRPAVMSSAVFHFARDATEDS